VRLIIWPQRCSRPLCSSQNTGGTQQAVRLSNKFNKEFFAVSLLIKSKKGGASRPLRTQQRA